MRTASTSGIKMHAGMEEHLFDHCGPLSSPHKLGALRFATVLLTQGIQALFEQGLAVTRPHT